MKTLTAIGAMSVLLFVACTSAETDPVNTNANVETPAPLATNNYEGENVAEDTTNCCANSPVAYQGTMFWRKSWEYFLSMNDTFQTDDPLNFISSFPMKAEELENLHNQCITCEGMRVYYGATQASDGHYDMELVFANVDGCDDVLPSGKNPKVLSSKNGGSHVTPKYGKDRIDAWRDYSEAVQNSTIPAFMHIKGYTFEWSSFDTVIGQQQDDTVSIYLGMHTVGAFDTVSYNMNNWPTTENGTYIYGQLAPNFILENSVGSEHIDFANPCPRYCGRAFFEELEIIQ
jgi:hypothetical protein